VKKSQIQTATEKFKIGQTYQTRSICDYDTILSFEILSRTAKTVTIRVGDKTVRRGLYVYDGVEQFKPYGTYSMCAIIGADDLAVLRDTVGVG
jgi:hypothetical protein